MLGYQSVDHTLLSAAAHRAWWQWATPPRARSLQHTILTTRSRLYMSVGNECPSPSGACDHSPSVHAPRRIQRGREGGSPTARSSAASLATGHARAVQSASAPSVCDHQGRSHKVHVEATFTSCHVHVSVSLNNSTSKSSSLSNGHAVSAPD